MLQFRYSLIGYFIHFIGVVCDCLIFSNIEPMLKYIASSLILMNIMEVYKFEESLKYKINYVLNAKVGTA